MDISAPSMRHLGFFLTEDDGVVLEQLLDPGQGGVGLRTDKTELKNLVGIAAILGLDSCNVVVLNRLLITCKLVSVKGDNDAL